MKNLLLASLCFALFPLFMVNAQTGNDCSDPLPYPGDVVNGQCVTGYDFSVFNDTGLSPIPTCDFAYDAYGWFSWTAPVTTVAGDPLYLNFDAGFCGIGVEFYTADCLSPVSSCLGNVSGFITGLTQGADYLIQIWDDGSGGYSCDFCLTIAPPPPPGDECIDPIPYPGDIENGVCVNGFDFSNFTFSGGSPSPVCIPAFQTVWFNVTTPVTTVAGDPINLLFDGAYCSLSVEFYLTDCFTSLNNCVFINGILTGLTQGTDYLMVVNDFYGNGICDFCVTVAPPPPLNDSCTGAIPYPGDVESGVCVSNLNFATATDTGPYFPTCDGSGDPDIWYSWTAPVTTAAGDPINLIFDDGTGQTNNCFLGIEFYALDCQTPVSNCLANNSGIISGLTQGTDYLILVYDDGPAGFSCDFCLSIAPPPPPNDSCTGAIPYPGDVENGICVTDLNFAVAVDSGGNLPTCDGNGDPDVWYSWTAPVTTVPGDPINLLFDDGTGQANNCFLGIEFYALDCQTPVSNCLSNNNGTIFGLTQGTDYLMLVYDDGPGGFACDFCLTIAPPPPPGNECFDPIPYPGDIGNGTCVSGFDFTGFASSGASPNISCGFFAEPQAWFTITMPITTAAGDPINLLFDDGYCDVGIEFYALDCSAPASNCLFFYNGGTITGLTQGTEYLLLVQNPFGNTICDFCLTIAPPPPPGDYCIEAIPYPGDIENGVCVTSFDFNQFTDSGGNLPTCDGTNDADVWFSWTAPIISAPGDIINLIFDNGTGQYNNCFLGIEFYATDCTTPVSNCLPNVSGNITGLSQGTDYLILVYDDGPGGTSCDFCLTVAPPSITPDDLCNAYPLTLDEDCSLTLPYSNLGASPQVGEPIPDCYTDGSVEASVWFSFIAPPSGAVSISTDFFGSGMQDSQLALFESSTGDCSDLFTLNEIACNEDAVPFPFNTDFNAALPPIAVNPGQIYFIQVDGYFDYYYGYASEGNFCIVVSDANSPSNDDCAAPEVYGGFGFDCTKIFNGTTIGASSDGSTDIFSCDGQEYNSSVYYSFSTGVSEVEFNLLSGFNVNVTLFTDDCQNGGVEVSGNCFTNIYSSSDPNVLFTNLIPGSSYIMVIWTNESDATDFSFCLTRPTYMCGDSYCYDLAENYSNCPYDCPCESDLFFYNLYSGFSSSSTVYGVCPEIVGATTDPNNPGLFIPFFLNTNDLDLVGSTISTTFGTLYNSNNPPIPLPNNQATNFFMYIFLTEAEIAAGGLNTITFISDGGTCFAELTFNVSDLNYTSPSTSECGNCNLIIEPDYDNVTCNGNSVSLGISFQNATGYNICLRQDNDFFCNNNDFFLDPFYTTFVNFPNTDITLTIIDEGMPNCAYSTTFYTGDFACSGSGACIDYYDTPTSCRLDPEIMEEEAICNGDGTLSIPIDLGRPTGTVSFNPVGTVSGSGTDSDPFNVEIDLNNCSPIDLTITDESTCDLTPIVTVNSPSSIAGGITVATNSADWGVQIPAELGLCGSATAVTGNVVTVNDGDTSGGQLTDFCEPTPPIPPDPSICTNLQGNIVLIDRGQCNFTTKVENAQSCGAIGVVICNCQPGPGWCAADADVLITMASGGTTAIIDIPAVFMLYEDCQEIKAELNNGNPVELCIGAPQEISGCSREITVDICNDYQCAPDEVINPSTCECELDTGTCEEEITGSISAPDEGCDVSGIEVVVVAPDGTSITATSGADGSFTLPGGPFPCGTYSATIITPPMDLPDCYTATGTVGPISFEVDGEGNGNDGPNFIANPEIPTLSQWGLIILALLMMTFGAIRLTNRTFNFQQKNMYLIKIKL